MQHRFGVVRVVNRLTHPHDVAALLDEVLNIIVSALVCELGKLDALACELFVKVVQVQSRGWQVLHAWQKNCGLQLGHRRFELWRNQRQGFMFYS